MVIASSFSCQIRLLFPQPLSRFCRFCAVKNSNSYIQGPQADQDSQCHCGLSSDGCSQHAV